MTSNLQVLGVTVYLDPVWIVFRSWSSSKFEATRGKILQQRSMRLRVKDDFPIAVGNSCHAGQEKETDSRSRPQISPDNSLLPTDWSMGTRRASGGRSVATQWSSVPVDHAVHRLLQLAFPAATGTHVLYGSTVLLVTRQSWHSSCCPQ